MRYLKLTIILITLITMTSTSTLRFNNLNVTTNGDPVEFEFFITTRSVAGVEETTTRKELDFTRDKRQIFQGNSTNGNVTNPNVTSINYLTTKSPEALNLTENVSIPVKEIINDDILISYPSNFGGNFQIALEDPDSNSENDFHHHPFWFLRPVFKKISNVVNYLNHPNTALNPAQIVQKVKNKISVLLNKTYKDICGDKLSFYKF